MISSFWRALALIFILQTFLTAPTHAQDSPNSLGLLEIDIERDLKRLQIPPRTWLYSPFGDGVIDVAIVGGGMAGMTAAFALMQEGITHITLFDANPAGQAGPWERCARMEQLRSDKHLAGPAIAVPNLTFSAWYEAVYDLNTWGQIKSARTEHWSAYLGWFGKVLNLPIETEMILKEIAPVNGVLALTFDQCGQRRLIYARKIVLATGPEGFGGVEIPDYTQNISKKYYAHTLENIASERFVDKRVVVVGAGASAFDVAAVALEEGAKSVEMFVRRPEVPLINKFSRFSYPGIFQGFSMLSDEMRCLFFVEGFESGVPPSKDALDRVQDFKNFFVRLGTDILGIAENKETLTLHTTKGDLYADFLVFATGYAIDGSKRPELANFFDEIQLWETHVPAELLQQVPKLGRFPYLGSHFQFQEKVAGSASFLKHLYCFNYGAILSQGLVSGDIPGIGVGATRLAEGIAADFFVEDQEIYWKRVRDYQSPLYRKADYPMLSEDVPDFS